MVQVLSGRCQAVKYGNAVSDSGAITCGVPRGSILGPLLYIIQVNDMPNAFVGAKLNLYADDTAFTVQSNTPLDLARQLQCQVDKAATWLAKNRLSLNVNKNKIMIFGPRQMISKCNDLSISYNNKEIELVVRFKYLGLILDGTLSFKHDVEYICHKIVPRLKMLAKMRSIASEAVCLHLYKALLMPMLDYWDVVYDCLY